jgi:DNA-binding beta-propeller fold protein YncE
MDVGAKKSQSQDSSAQPETRGVEFALDEKQLDEKQATRPRSRENPLQHYSGSNTMILQARRSQPEVLVAYDDAKLAALWEKVRSGGNEACSPPPGSLTASGEMPPSMRRVIDGTCEFKCTGNDERVREKEIHRLLASDEDDVAVEIITGGGCTHKFSLPPTATVLVLKQCVECVAGFKSVLVKLYVHDDSREDALENGETLGSLRRGKGLAVLITLVVHAPNAEVVAGLAVEADLVLGDGTKGDSDGLMNEPYGVAFMPAHLDWFVTTEYGSTRVKISNIRTGALICKFGERGSSGERQFYSPWGVAVTSSSFVIVVDWGNHRMKVLRLVVAADGSNAHLEFVRHIGNGRGSGEGQLRYPSGVAVLPVEGEGQETVLVADCNNHRVSQFKLDGTFICIFAGTGTQGSGDGEFDIPRGITVLGSSGEVAVADYNNHRVQIFDREGNYTRQFGSEGQEADGHLRYPGAIASDVHGNLLVLDNTSRLQVFSAEGKHLCTRSDLGVRENSPKGIAWSDVGELAIANGSRNKLVLWQNE